MGGLGAKNRRRFQREQTNPRDMNMRNRTPSRSEGAFINKYDGIDAVSKSQQQQQQHNNNNSGNKKQKKPKHLKRKLEHSTDAGERANVLRQIQMLEQSKQKKKPCRHRRLEHESIWDPPVVTLAEEKTMFPRENNTMTTSVKLPTINDPPMQGLNPSSDHENNNKIHGLKDAAETKQSKRRRGRKGKDDTIEKDEKANDISITTTHHPKDVIDDNAKDDDRDHRDETKESDSNNSSSSSSDDEEEKDTSNVMEHRRERGKRRRGRIHTSEQKQEEPVQNNVPPETEKPRNGRRYCKGRKPVTDFVIGNRYPAKVVHAKPYGVFFDIGCHSDAFCHVSRLSDEYVSNPQERFHEGDSVHVRVIEIHRTRKQITVSLQSEARIADEQASMMARNERQQKHSGKKKNSVDPTHSPKPVTPKPDVAPPVEDATTKPLHCSFASKTDAVLETSCPDNPNSTSDSDLRRARKLARRAARRAAQETSHELFK